MAIYFDTREYERAHGHTPRGRGSWAFFFGGTSKYAEAAWFTPGSTTYGEAKRLARAEAKSRGVEDVIVGS